MTPEDFFTYSDDPLLALENGFRLSLVEKIRAGPLADTSDLKAAQALTSLLHDELELEGTGSSSRLDNFEVEKAMAAHRAVLSRLGMSFSLPFRNFKTFKNYWIRNGCANSYQARRSLLEGLLGPVHQQFQQIEDAEFQATLAQGVSPHGQTGWAGVDIEIAELRKRFLTASSPQDYRAIGTHCVGVLEALSRKVYDPTKHVREGEEPLDEGRSKDRIERFVEDAARGSDLADVRGLVRKAITLAHKVKHRQTPTRREAGIISDTVILLAHMLRRLDEWE